MVIKKYFQILKKILGLNYTVKKYFEKSIFKIFGPKKQKFFFLSLTCIMLLTVSRSDRISDKVLVPRMFLSVVWARRRVEWEAFSTFTTLTYGLKIL